MLMLMLTQQISEFFYALFGYFLRTDSISPSVDLEIFQEYPCNYSNSRLGCYPIGGRRSR
jgi:hypothetical protein